MKQLSFNRKLLILPIVLYLVFSLFVTDNYYKIIVLAIILCIQTLAFYNEVRNGSIPKSKIVVFLIFVLLSFGMALATYYKT